MPTCPGTDIPPAKTSRFSFFLLVLHQGYQLYYRSGINSLGGLNGDMHTDFAILPLLDLYNSCQWQFSRSRGLFSDTYNVPTWILLASLRHLQNLFKMFRYSQYQHFQTWLIRLWHNCHRRKGFTTWDSFSSGSAIKGLWIKMARRQHFELVRGFWKGF